MFLRTEPKKVLNPTNFQEFELQEKTVISHNVAMYVPCPHAKAFDLNLVRY